MDPELIARLLAQADVTRAPAAPRAPSPAGRIVSTALDFIPGIGDVKGVAEGAVDLAEGDVVGAGLGAIGLLPIVGDLTRLFGRGVRRFRRAGQAVPVPNQRAAERRLADRGIGARAADPTLTAEQLQDLRTLTRAELAEKYGAERAEELERVMRAPGDRRSIDRAIEEQRARSGPADNSRTGRGELPSPRAALERRGLTQLPAEESIVPIADLAPGARGQPNRPLRLRSARTVNEEPLRATTHHLEFDTPEGPLGAKLAESPDQPGVLEIEEVGPLTDQGQISFVTGVMQPGPRVMRQILDEISDLFPTFDRVSGARVTGARRGLDPSEQLIEIPLRRRRR